MLLCPISSNFILLFQIERNMKKKRNPVKFAVLGASWITLLLALCSIYMDAKKNMVASMEVALEDAILKDYQERHNAELKFSSGRLGRKVKEIKVVTEEGEERFEFKDSIDETVAGRWAAQYLLAQIRPIHPDTLNGILQEELIKYDIQGETGIIYTYKGKSQYSGKDSVATYQSSMHLGIPRMVDIKKMVQVQAWIDMTPWNIVKNMHDGAFWGLLAFFGVMFLGSFTSWEAKDPNKVKFGKMLLNKEAKKVIIGGKECPLRKQEFQLLLMFVEKPNHSLSRGEIKSAFWGEGLGVNNRVSNLLCTLRTSLKDFPECQITINEGKGYTLIVDSEPSLSLIEKEGV